MHHFQGTARTHPWLYYQRIFIRGYVALSLPAIMAAISDVATGFIYLPRHTKGLLIRDFDNRLVHDPKSNVTIGTEHDPMRAITDCIRADARIEGRKEPLTWVYTKDDFAANYQRRDFHRIHCLRSRTVPERTASRGLEWKGRMHRVAVLSDGFSWNGKTYASLSKIAHAITGTRWNGPRFFGLRERTRDKPPTKLQP